MSYKRMYVALSMFIHSLYVLLWTAGISVTAYSISMVRDSQRQYFTIQSPRYNPAHPILDFHGYNHDLTEYFL